MNNKHKVCRRFWRLVRKHEPKRYARLSLAQVKKTYDMLGYERFLAFIRKTEEQYGLIPEDKAEAVGVESKDNVDSPEANAERTEK